MKLPIQHLAKFAVVAIVTTAFTGNLSAQKTGKSGFSAKRIKSRGTIKSSSSTAVFPQNSWGATKSSPTGGFNSRSKSSLSMRSAGNSSQAQSVFGQSTISQKQLSGFNRSRKTTQPTDIGSFGASKSRSSNGWRMSNPQEGGTAKTLTANQNSIQMGRMSNGQAFGNSRTMFRSRSSSSQLLTTSNGGSSFKTKQKNSKQPREASDSLRSLVQPRMKGTANALKVTEEATKVAKPDAQGRISLPVKVNGATMIRRRLSEKKLNELAENTGISRDQLERANEVGTSEVKRLIDTVAAGAVIGASDDTINKAIESQLGSKGTRGPADNDAYIDAIKKQYDLPDVKGANVSDLTGVVAEMNLADMDPSSTKNWKNFMKFRGGKLSAKDVVRQRDSANGGGGGDQPGGSSSGGDTGPDAGTGAGTGQDMANDAFPGNLSGDYQGDADSQQRDTGSGGVKGEIVDDYDDQSTGTSKVTHTADGYRVDYYDEFGDYEGSENFTPDGDGGYVGDQGGSSNGNGRPKEGKYESRYDDDGSNRKSFMAPEETSDDESDDSSTGDENASNDGGDQGYTPSQGDAQPAATPENLAQAESRQQWINGGLKNPGDAMNGSGPDPDELEAQPPMAAPRQGWAINPGVNGGQQPQPSITDWTKRFGGIGVADPPKPTVGAGFAPAANPEGPQVEAPGGAAPSQQR
jgi:hypothetical protein